MNIVHSIVIYHHNRVDCNYIVHHISNTKECLNA